MPDLYDSDILLWSERQAALLRGVAAGKPANDAPEWANIIEEIESVGNEQRFKVESPLRQALIHMLKGQAWPLAGEVPHWQAESRVSSSSREGGSPETANACRS